MLIPELTPSGTSEVEAGRSIGVPPPARHRPLRGTPHSVRWYPIEAVSRGSTAAQKAGLRYEAKVRQFLAASLRDFHSPVELRFQDDSGPRRLVPDGIYFSPYGTAVIFEIKIQHMAEAWWQLRKLYTPVVAALPFVNRVSCVEVVRSHDPSMGFPENGVIARSVQEAIEAPAQLLKVLVWRP